MEKNYCGLIGLDLDGTVFNNDKKISENNRRAIEKAIGRGYCVIPVTGRPVAGIPEELMSLPYIEYAVTSNGAVIYQIEDFARGKWNRIYEDMLPEEKVLEVLEILEQYTALPDCFVQGSGHMPEYAKEWIPKMGLAPVMAQYLLKGREFFPDLAEYVRQTPQGVEKITINFFLTPEGIQEKKQAYERLLQVRDITVVSGAPHNLEVNTLTAKKGNGLLMLARLLGIEERNTMACGDDSNDLDMIEKAAFGVAMGNAAEIVKRDADFITRSNEEDGVALAIEEFMGRHKFL